MGDYWGIVGLLSPFGLHHAPHMLFDDGTIAKWFFDEALNIQSPFFGCFLVLFFDVRRGVGLMLTELSAEEFFSITSSTN